MSQSENNFQSGVSSQAPQPAAASSIAVPTSENARQRQRIADLEEKLQVLESGQVVKKRCCDDDDKDNDHNVTIESLRQGADGARRDDTSKLKSLIPEWVNHKFRPNPPVDMEDKFCCEFTNDACGKLLCPSELDWNNLT
ncbi:hypothetical protein BDR07DRAFT_1370884 [Suillus spraguei]|nr:hypothetical protein BDR07DRAFT_1370884 [Suillus spraguei]